MLAGLAFLLYCARLFIVAVVLIARFVCIRIRIIGFLFVGCGVVLDAVDVFFVYLVFVGEHVGNALVSLVLRLFGKFQFSDIAGAPCVILRRGTHFIPADIAEQLLHEHGDQRDEECRRENDRGDQQPQVRVASAARRVVRRAVVGRAVARRNIDLARAVIDESIVLDVAVVASVITQVSDRIRIGGRIVVCVRVAVSRVKIVVLVVRRIILVVEEGEVIIDEGSAVCVFRISSVVA